MSGQQQIWDNAYNAALKEGLDEIAAKRIADAVDPYVGNPMPESVKDRCTRSHEYLFLLTKSARYYWDKEAIAEGLKEASIKRNQRGWNGNEGRGYVNGKQNHMSKYLGSDAAKSAATRNRRSVWVIPTKSYSGSHFATFPEALVEPCILAGTSEKGACPKCGKAWERVVESDNPTRTFPDNGKGVDERKEDGTNLRAGERTTTTLGWRPGCECDAGDPVPCLVLDPFCGSGTVGAVCAKYGRSFVGLDLNMGYLSELATERIGEAEEAALLEQRQPMLFEVAR